MTEFSKQSSERERPERTPSLLRMLGRNAIYYYNHLPIIRARAPEPLFATVEKKLVDSPQPLHPDINTTVKDVQNVLRKHNVDIPKPLSFSDKLLRCAHLEQFTGRFVGGEQVSFAYNNLRILKDRFVASAKEQEYPLSFGQQLNIALELASTDMDIIDTLTNL